MADRPFTIFHVDGERGFRGGERQLLYLAATLRARGHSNVICGRHRGELDREARRQGFETLTLPFRCEFDPVSAWRLARAAAGRARPILHAHTAHAAGIALMARWFGGPPTVAHRRVDFPLRAGSRFKYGRMGRLVAVSNAIASVLEQDGIPAARISVIHDTLPASPEEWRWAGVEEPAIAPVDAGRRQRARQALAQAFGLDLAAPWIGNLAALVPHKDHRTLISAVPIVHRRHPGAVFLIAGRGPEEPSLRALIGHLGVRDRVMLLGHQDPGRLLAALDLFVLSSWGEGMGSVLLEAAACGVPVVATAAGGIPDVVQDRLTGLLAPPQDPPALARCLTELLDDPGLARRLSTAAFEALPRFGLARAAERLERLYQALEDENRVRAFTGATNQERWGRRRPRNS